MRIYALLALITDFSDFQLPLQGKSNKNIERQVKTTHLKAEHIQLTVF